MSPDPIYTRLCVYCYAAFLAVVLITTLFVAAYGGFR